MAHTYPAQSEMLVHLRMTPGDANLAGFAVRAGGKIIPAVQAESKAVFDLGLGSLLKGPSPTLVEVAVTLEKVNPQSKFATVTLEFFQTMDPDGPMLDGIPPETEFNQKLFPVLNATFAPGQNSVRAVDEYLVI